MELWNLLLFDFDPYTYCPYFLFVYSNVHQIAVHVKYRLLKPGRTQNRTEFYKNTEKFVRELYLNELEILQRKYFIWLP